MDIYLKQTFHICLPRIHWFTFLKAYSYISVSPCQIYSSKFRENCRSTYDFNLPIPTSAQKKKKISWFFTSLLLYTTYQNKFWIWMATATLWDFGYQSVKVNLSFQYLLIKNVLFLLIRRKHNVLKKIQLIN